MVAISKFSAQISETYFIGISPLYYKGFSGGFNIFMTGMYQWMTILIGKVLDTCKYNNESSVTGAHILAFC